MAACTPDLPLSIKTSTTIRDPRFVFPPTPIPPALPGGGPNNPSGNAKLTIDEVFFFATVDGAQTYNLPPSARAIAGVYINGLRQLIGSYTVTGTSLDLPASLDIVAGDYVAIEFII